MESLITTAAQQSFKGLFGPVALLALLIAAGIIFLSVMRPYFFPKNKSMDGVLDPSLLDGALDKGGMTKDEMRRVRKVMVRQALEQQEQKSSASVNDLGSIIAQAQSGQLKPTSVAAKPVTHDRVSPQVPIAPVPPARPIPKPVTSLSDIRLSSPADSKEDNNQAAELDKPRTQGKSSVDVHTLYEKGLISRAEYEKLSGYFSRANKDKRS